MTLRGSVATTALDGLVIDGPNSSILIFSSWAFWPKNKFVCPSLKDTIFLIGRCHADGAADDEEERFYMCLCNS